MMGTAMGSKICVLGKTNADDLPATAIRNRHSVVMTFILTPLNLVDILKARWRRLFI